MPPRILFLGSGLDAASWRFRVGQYLPHLRERGFEVDSADLHRPLPQRLATLAAAARYDAVCVHRVLLPPFEAAWLRRAAPRYMFDFDDAIMLRDSAHPRFDSWQRRRRLRRMLRGAHTVIAGNAYLAAWARRYHADVAVIPTAVDLTAYGDRTEDWGLRTESESLSPQSSVLSPAVIGWIGTSSNLMYVRQRLPALRRLVEHQPEVTIKIVCDRPLEAPGLPLINQPWSLAGEVADLRSFQIGIMPLPDDPWTRGKCAVKILQYFAAGLPVVCSPVGANLDVVEHGRSGYFAAGDDEWIARLDELLADADLRRRLGAHGRRVVEERFSVQMILPRLLETLLR
jgi:hypothetical protein